MPEMFFNLQIFAESGDSAAGTGEVAAPTTENPVSDGVATGGAGEQVVTANGTNQTPERVSFEDLIAGEYKEDYEKAVKSAISKRLKNQRDLQGQIDSIDPIVKMIAQRYGVQPGQDGRIPIQALQDALLNDNSLYEQEAFQRGISVDELKNIKRLEHENAALRQQNARSAEQRDWDALIQQGEEMKGMYPDFDLETEMQDQNFGRLLATMQKSGFPNAVRTAYEAVHRDEIMGGAMKYAVAQTEKKIANSIQSGINRPAENGTSQQATASIGAVDPSKLTRAQINDIKMRAERGERITF